MSTCIIPAQWEVVRVTRVDACGRPIYGDCSAIVSKCIATISDSPEVEEGEARVQTGFDGKPCYTSPTCDKVNFHTLEITWSQISIDGFSFMNPGYRISRDKRTGEAIGMFATNVIDCSAGYAVEVWASSGGTSDACTGQGGEGSWYYRVYPWVSGATPGEMTMGGTDEVAFTFTGKTKSGSRWGKGPYQINLEAGVPAGLPDAFDPTKEEPYWEGLVTLPPPEDSCDCVEVDRPIPEKAIVVITGREDDTSRLVVDLFADNRGFGPVMVNWGDGSAVQEVPEMLTATHTYAAGTPSPVTVTVCDKTDPAVCETRTFDLPLESDLPVLVVEDAATADRPNQVRARVTLPDQATGGVILTWGDRTESVATATGSPKVVEVVHNYRYGGRYRIVAARAERKTLRDRKTVTVPMTSPTSVAAATNLTATALTATGATINWQWAKGGGMDVVNFVVQHRTTPAGTWTSSTNLPATARTHPLTGLIAATNYEARVVASNTAAVPPTTTSASVLFATPATGPATPTATTANAVSPTEADVTWQEGTAAPEGDEPPAARSKK